MYENLEHIIHKYRIKEREMNGGSGLDWETENKILDEKAQEIEDEKAA